MCICVTVDGLILGDRGHPFVHDGHASCCPLPHVWNYEIFPRKEKLFTMSVTLYIYRVVFFAVTLST